ncbi:MAG: hypothetical protein IGS03_07105 [Candidatus Sericytochromatia bacterium]|nr:hypothetical protein [Candidatus Sericytochromatia bacterium]
MPYMQYLLIALLGLLSACGGRLPATESQARYEALILSPTERAILVLDLLTHRVRRRLVSGDVPSDLLVGSGGRIFVSHRQEPAISVLQRNDPGTWYRIGKVGAGVTPGRLAWNETWQELLVAGEDQALLSIYTMPGLRRPVLSQTLRLDARNSAPAGLVFSPEQDRLYVAGAILEAFARDDTGYVSLLRQVLGEPDQQRISDMLYAREHLWLADQRQDQLLVVSPETLETVQTIELSQPGYSAIFPARMAVNHTQTKLYLTGSGASVVQVIDLQARKHLQTLSLQAEALRFPAGSPFGIAVSPDDRRVYVTAQSGRNLVILEASPDVSVPETILRTLGTAESEALLPPLGTIRIFE